MNLFIFEFSPIFKSLMRLRGIPEIVVSSQNSFNCLSNLTITHMAKDVCMVFNGLVQSIRARPEKVNPVIARKVARAT